jgi:hypothetical protein
MEVCMTKSITDIINDVASAGYAPLTKVSGGIPASSYIPKTVERVDPQYVQDITKYAAYGLPGQYDPRLLVNLNDIANKYNLTDQQAQAFKTIFYNMENQPVLESALRTLTTPPETMVTNLQSRLTDIANQAVTAGEQKLKSYDEPTQYTLGQYPTTPITQGARITKPEDIAKSQLEKYSDAESERYKSMEQYQQSIQSLAEQLSSRDTSEAIAQGIVSDFVVDSMKHLKAAVDFDITPIVSWATKTVTQNQEYLDNIKSTLANVVGLEVDFNELLRESGMWR